VILGASFDPGPANAAFARKFNFNFPLLTVDAQTAMKYGAASDASAKSAGRAAVIIAPDGTVKQWFPKVAAATFPQEALQLL
jgi:thioredoxin-dependent peroxiredoxin